MDQSQKLGGMLSDHELLKLLLPEFLVEHFDILNAEPHDAELHIYFEEKKDQAQNLGARQKV